VLAVDPQVTGRRGLRAAPRVGAVPGPLPATILCPSKRPFLPVGAQVGAPILSVARFLAGACRVQHADPVALARELALEIIGCPVARNPATRTPALLVPALWSTFMLCLLFHGCAQLTEAGAPGRRAP
jgi:hypothetical protein